ncbi:rhomboid family intramembrane serine protease [Clostridium sp. JN-1]|uniref:rhomboid family intramembrane serine protease n=1 Tax=Clostridium sp. JN-1 TaxID=2483110 RepID=UPI000F0AFF64|nr:rhomboid family intramembrane serine protease [Clostridium sp. JN-1]
MERFVKNLIEGLCRLYNFNIVEFNNAYGLIGNFGVIKKGKNNMEVIFFSDFNYRNHLDKDELKSFLKSELKCNNLSLVEVSIGSSLNLKQYNSQINPQCGLILIDVVEKNILCSDSTLKETANKLAYCMNIITTKHDNVRKKTPMPIITYVIAALNIIAYIITAYLSNNIVDSNINVLVFLGAKVNSLISQGEYYRLITCMFLHGGIIHITLNMYALVALGPLIENIYGKSKYIIIYFISGIMSSIFSFKFSPSISIGASGAIFGLLGAALIFGIKMKGRINKDYTFNIVSVIIVNLIIGFSMPNVDNFGHLGGLIGGVLTSSLLFPHVSKNLKGGESV